VLAFVLTLHLVQPQLGLAPPPARDLHLEPVALADDAPIAPPPFEAPVQPAPVQAAPPPPNLHLMPAPLVDPLAGSFSFAELGLAALGNLVTWIGFGLVASQFGVDQGGEEAALTVVALMAVPAVSSLIAWAFASRNAAGTFAKALLRAGLVQVLGMLAVVGVLELSGGSDAGAATALVSVAVIELVGVPMAASFGMHAGPAVQEGSPAAQTRSELPEIAAAQPVPHALKVGFQF